MKRFRILGLAAWAAVLAMAAPAGAQGAAPGYLGVSLADVEVKAGDEGARVESVAPDSPAEKAGLVKDDVVVRYDGEAVRSAGALARMVRETAPGRTVSLDVRRGRAHESLQIAVGARSESAAEWGRELSMRRLPRLEGWTERASPRDERPGRLGIRFQEISGQLARYFHAEHDPAILVTEVAEGTPAARAGLRAGDVVVRVGSADVESGHVLRQAVAEAEPDHDLEVKVLREGKILDFRVHLGPKSGNATAL